MRLREELSTISTAVFECSGYTLGNEQSGS